MAVQDDLRALLARPAWIFCWGIDDGDLTPGARERFFHGRRPRHPSGADEGILWARPGRAAPRLGGLGFRLGVQAGTSRRGLHNWGLLTSAWVVPLVIDPAVDDAGPFLGDLMEIDGEDEDYWAPARVGLDDGTAVEAVATRSLAFARSAAGAFDAPLLYHLADDIDSEYRDSPPTNVSVQDQGGTVLGAFGYAATIGSYARDAVLDRRFDFGPALGDRCPECREGRILPVVFGLVGAPQPDDPPVILGGCVVLDVDRGCPECGARWADGYEPGPDDEEEVEDEWEEEVDDLDDVEDRDEQDELERAELEAAQLAFDETPELEAGTEAGPGRRRWWPDDVGEPELANLHDLGDDAQTLAANVVEHAVAIEHRAAALAALGLVADGLCAGLGAIGWPVGSREPAERFANAVTSGVARAGEAESVARRVAQRVSERMRALDTDSVDDETDAHVYEEILTTRMHLPIAESIVADAEADVRGALRDLARTVAGAVTLAGAADETARELLHRALGVLRLALPADAEPRLAEDGVEVWSTGLDTLPLEIAGLVANLLADHRNFLILAIGEGRFVQCITYETRLWCESIGDEFVDAPLPEEERARLVELGWTPEQGDPESPSPNWSKGFDPPVAIGDAATLLARTLIDVHGLESPAELEIEVDVVE